MTRLDLAASSIERAYGGSGNDELTGTGAASALFMDGADGDDTLAGVNAETVSSSWFITIKSAIASYQSRKFLTRGGCGLRFGIGGESLSMDSPLSEVQPWPP
ncbi:hypothetical protein [Azospirillum sp. B510]|uniref:hypothetical protein n=1 Tax=Azospirillum sp. (strain B510) TaxID=137722 RepID=UPI0011D11453|nr:hypothetical protein [Azospirillum sp. B510]